MSRKQKSALLVLSLSLLFSTLAVAAGFERLEAHMVQGINADNGSSVDAALWSVLSVKLQVSVLVSLIVAATLACSHRRASRLASLGAVGFSLTCYVLWTWWSQGVDQFGFPGSAPHQMAGSGVFDLASGCLTMIAFVFVLDLANSRVDGGVQSVNAEADSAG